MQSNTNLEGKIAIAPTSNSAYITANKEYRILRSPDKESFVITDDQCHEVYCKVKHCGHIGGNDWTIIS